MKPNVIIVGAGVVGLVAAKLAAREGAHVTIVSDSSILRTTDASGFLLRPSWATSIPKEDVIEGYNLLRELYTVEDLEFRVTPTRIKVKVQRAIIPLKVPVNVTHINSEVVSVKDGEVTTREQGRLKGKVLVAAGINCGNLVKMPPVIKLMGVSLLFKGAQLKEPLMNVWAPYKQALAFNYSKDKVWFGDGTTILEKNWDTEERTDAAVARARKLFKLSGECAYCSRARPFVEGCKAGYFDRPFKNTWVSTGGAKNGTLIAAINALKFVREAL